MQFYFFAKKPRTSWPIAWLIAGCVLATASRAAAMDAARAAGDLRTKYAADIEQLAQWCEKNGLKAEADKTRRVLVPNDPYKLYVPVLPERIGPSKPPIEAPDSKPAVKWEARLFKLRADHAAALYDIARHAARNDRAAMAFELALAAIQANPDSEPLRRLFGYQKFHDQWRTPYEARKLRGGFVWHEKFGWLPKAYVRRYEEGQRYDEGRWISAAEDAKRHGDIRNGWVIDTEHYTIRTNHSIEAAVAMGVKLERLYRLWQELFIRYYASEADVIALFDGRGRGNWSPAQRHSIFFFRDRDDYNNSLKMLMPNVEMSIGLYLEQARRAYFFADKENNDRTLYHEATHQLFHESRTVPAEVGRDANFWIIEGIAMYMESLRQEDGYYVLGGFDDPRVHAAEYRLINDNFYVPLSTFTAYGMEQFQKDTNIAMLYSQAAGLANFLIYYDGGRYRDVVVSYLLAVYTRRADSTTLSKLTGVEYGELDKQYREYMEKRPRSSLPAASK